MVYHEFSVPADDRYFEDYVAGRIYEFGSFTLEEEEMLSFARRYDPQPFHVDPQKAEQGPYHGLIASGLQTISIVTRLYMDHYMSTVAGMGSPGMDEVRWPKPVRPGDTLRLRVTIVETRPSSSRKDRGLVTALAEGINQKNEVVASLRIVNIIKARNPL